MRFTKETQLVVLSHTSRIAASAISTSIAREIEGLIVSKIRAGINRKPCLSGILEYYSALPPGHIGGDRGIRTPDLCDANAALSQLSYIPMRLDSNKA
jgi:hypothetical protein